MTVNTIAGAPATTATVGATGTWATDWQRFSVASVAALGSAAVGASLTAYLLRGAEAMDTYWSAMSPSALAVRALGGAFAALPLVWLGGRAHAALHAPNPVHRGLARASLAAAALAAAAIGASSYRAAHERGFDADDRITAFDALLDTLRTRYGHRDFSPVTADALAARWRPRVVTAARGCDGDPCREYLTAIRDALAELQDLHVGLRSAALESTGAPMIETALADGALVVSHVRPLSDAAHAGVAPGMTIRSIDHRSVADALAAVPAWRVAASADRTRALLRSRDVARGPLDQPCVLELEHGPTVALARSSWSITPAVESRVVAPGVLLIAVHSLGDRGVPAAFDRALARPDVRALVIDLRGNGGGNSMLGDQIVARLIDRTVAYGHVCDPPARPTGADLSDCGSLTIAPRESRFTGRVAALIDGEVVSSGEFLAAALCGAHVARCFGRRTAGASGHPTTFDIPGGTVRYSTRYTYQLDGENIERAGVAPDIPIEWHVADYTAGRDPDLDAALQWLGP